jgi:hypothetical protein
MIIVPEMIGHYLSEFSVSYSPLWMGDLVLLVQHALSGSFLSSEMGHLLWVDVDFSAPSFSN